MSTHERTAQPRLRPVAYLFAAVLLLGACSGDDGNTLDLGPQEEIPLGEVTTFRDVGGDTSRWNTLPPVATEDEAIPIDLHVVRTAEPPLTIEVFLGRDPHSGCAVTWEADREYEDATGWFVAGCTGSIFNRAGERVFGPSPRNLDRLGAEINDEGHLIVHLDRLAPGDDVTTPVDSEEAAPTPAGTEPAADVVTSAVWVVDATTDAITTLVESDDTLIGHAAFNENGDSISVRMGAESRHFDLSGTEIAAPRAIQCEPSDGGTVVDGTTYPDTSCGSISPDGRWMLFETVTARSEHWIETTDAWLLDLATGETTLLQEELVHCGGCDGGYGPAWSASSRFVTYAELGGEGRVFLTDTSTAATRLLTHGNSLGQEPRWSPIRDEVAFDEGGTISILDPTTDAVRPVDLASPARWDPTGTYLYSPAIATAAAGQPGESTTVVHAPTGDWVDTLPGGPSVHAVWIDLAQVVHVEGSSYTAALERAEGCAGVTIYSGLRSDRFCVSGGFGPVISPDGTRVVMAVVEERGIRPTERRDWHPQQFARLRIVVVDVATGDITPAGEVWAFDDGRPGFGPRPPAITWNAVGTHFLVRSPATYGI